MNDGLNIFAPFCATDRFCINRAVERCCVCELLFCAEHIQKLDDDFYCEFDLYQKKHGKEN